MRILQICKKTPMPAKDGEALAILNFAKLLTSKNATVTMLAIATPKHNNSLKNNNEAFDKKIKYKQLFVNTNFSAGSALSAFFKNESYALQRFYCKKFEALIIEELKANSYDIVQLEGLYLVPYIASIKKNSKAKIVLRTHNVEHELWYKLSENTNNYFKKMLYKRNAKELQQVEQSSFFGLDAIVSISTADQTYFKQHHTKIPIHNLPFGIDVKDYQTQVQPFKKSIAFIGSLDWLPNLEGLHWFLKEVFPLVLNKIPNVHFYVAGRNLKAPEQFKHYASTTIAGEVADAKIFIAAHPVFVVPLLSGSGMRIKIIEAMALKRAVVSTTLGAAGINYSNQSNIAIADSPIDFANSIASLIQNEAKAFQIGESAHLLVKEQYNNDILGDQIIQFYNSLLS